MKFIIEHLEQELGEWSFIEYEHISKIVGKKNLIFTNIKSRKLMKFGQVINSSVKNLRLGKVCLLDPGAKETLTPAKAKKFEYLVFGGILGDFPAKNRTKERFKNFKISRFNLGKEQMSTDTAVLVTKMICSGTKLGEIKFKDHIEIGLDNFLAIVLPYRYVIKNRKPVISKELIDYLKKRNEI
ncbi:hypothetical protein HYT58_00235 [Candidatus Woesearchaeota archaeon]|nr:hypothetical protein [Candidatus Woesearchaeota archaeon]